MTDLARATLQVAQSFAPPDAALAFPRKSTDSPTSPTRVPAGLSSLFDYLCERNAVNDNPSHSVHL